MASKQDVIGRRSVLKNVGATTVGVAGLSGVVSADCDCYYKYDCRDGVAYRKECCECDGDEVCEDSWEQTQKSC